MIASIKKGSDFRGLFTYVLGSHDNQRRERAHVEIIGSTIPGTTVISLCRAMGAISALRPTVKKVVRHWMVSFPPEDRNKVTRDMLWSIGCNYANKMGATAYTIIAHKNDDGDFHLHIVANAVRHDGGYVRDSWDYALADETCRSIEADYNLRRVAPCFTVSKTAEGPRVHSTNIEKRAPTRAELEIAVKGEEPMRLTVQHLVDSVLASKPSSLKEFEKRLSAVGVNVKASFNKTGWYGVTYSYKGYTFKGQDLGALYKAKRLQQNGVLYEKNHDCTNDEPAGGGECGSRDGGGISRVGPAREAPERTAQELRESADCDSRTHVISADAGCDQLRETDRRESGGSNEHQRSIAGDGKASRNNISEPDGGGKKGDRQINSADGNIIRDNEISSDELRRDTNSTETSQSGQYDIQSTDDGWHITSSTDNIDSIISLGYSTSLSDSVGATGAPGASGCGGKLRSAGRKRVLLGEVGTVSGDQTGTIVRTQLSAMGGGQWFEIGILPPKDAVNLKPLAIRMWSIEDIVKNIRFLKAMNAKGYDIYVRCARTDSAGVEGNSGLILLDDLSEESLNELEEEYKPSVVIETSPKNFQALIRISDTRLPPDVASRIARALAKKFGADVGAATWCHFCRLAGFSNRKTRHKNAAGFGPKVVLHYAAKVLCAGGEKIVSWAVETLRRTRELERKRAADEHAAVQERMRSKQLLDGSRARDISLEQAFINAWAAVQPAKQDDRSARDYGAAKRLFLLGYTEAEIRMAMRLASPDIEKRKQGKHLDEYIIRTVSKAIDETDEPTSRFGM